MSAGGMVFDSTLVTELVDPVPELVCWIFLDRRGELGLPVLGDFIAGEVGDIGADSGAAAGAASAASLSTAPEVAILCSTLFASTDLTIAIAEEF